MKEDLHIGVNIKVLLFYAEKKKKTPNIEKVMIELSNEFFPVDEEVNIAAEDYIVNLPTGGGPGAYDDCDIKDAFIAGASFRKAMEETK